MAKSVNSRTDHRRAPRTAGRRSDSQRKRSPVTLPNKTAPAKTAPAKTPQRQQRSEMKRATILDAALDLFARYGLHGTTVDQIAEAANVSKTNLFYYFPTKEEVYVAALQTLLAQWLHPLLSLDVAADPVASLNGYIRQKMEFSRNSPEISRLFCLEIVQDREIERVIGDIDPAPHRFSGPQHPANRVVFMAVHVLHFMGDEPQRGLAGGAPPDEVGAEILRVQRAQLQRRPQQRKARRQHPPGEFVELAGQRRNMLGRACQPIDDRPDGVVLRPFGRWPLDNVADLKIPRIQAVYRIPIQYGHKSSGLNPGRAADRTTIGTPGQNTKTQRK